MKLMELFNAMANVIERVHLFYEEVGKVPSSLGVYKTFTIPEEYGRYEVCYFHIHDVDDNTHVDVVVKK